MLDTNERARGLYEAVGWQPAGAEKTDTFGDDELRELRYRRSLEDDA